MATTVHFKKADSFDAACGQKQKFATVYKSEDGAHAWAGINVTTYALKVSCKRCQRSPAFAEQREREVARGAEKLAEKREEAARYAAEDAERTNTLRRVHGATPAEFEAAGVKLERIDYASEPASEYQRRIKSRLPVYPPRYAVGEWAYNPIANQNQRVVYVAWDASGFDMPEWRYSLPGYSARALMGPRDGAPYVEHRKVAPDTWAPIPPNDPAHPASRFNPNRVAACDNCGNAGCIRCAPTMEECATHMRPGCIPCAMV